MEQEEGRAHVDKGAKTGSSGDSVKAIGILTFERCANNSKSVLLSEFNDILLLIMIIMSDSNFH